MIVPAPGKVMEYLNGAQVVYLDTFKDPFGAGWLFDIGKVKDGTIEIIGDNWRGFSRNKDFNEGQGVLVDFTYRRGSDFVAAMSNGSWNTISHKQFGIRITGNELIAQGWEGNRYIGRGNLLGNLTLEPDRTFQFLMAVLLNGEFLIVLWDPSDEKRAVFHHEKIGGNWSSLAWKLSIQANSGVVMFENYRELTFDSGK